MERTHDRTAEERIRRLIHRIYDSLGPDSGWRLKTGEVVRGLGEEEARFHRALYRVRDRIDYGAALEALDHRRAGDLVTVLEELYGPAAEAGMRREGLFLAHDDHIELTEAFLRTVQRAVSIHEADVEQFRAMVRVARRFAEALQIYYQEHFPLPPLMEEAWRIYAADRRAAGWKAGAVTRRVALSYLEDLFQRHVLSCRELFARVGAALRRALYGEAQEEGGAETETGAARDGGVSRALGLMGLSRAGLSLSELRSRYRALMKRYHPDVNPGGLEMCKRINAAYGRLLPLCR